MKMQSVLVEKAAAFAIAVHKDQRLRGKARSPFYTHPQAVAMWVEMAGGTEQQIAAAWLHDTVEDTETTIEVIQGHFGDIVAIYVDGLTDLPHMNAMPLLERKKFQAERVRNKCEGVQLVKLADQLVNLITLSLDPPIKWNKRKCLDYALGAKLIADECAVTSPKLYKVFLRIYDQLIKELAE